jgi:hypothetical protein
LLTISFVDNIEIRYDEGVAVEHREPSFFEVNALAGLFFVAALGAAVKAVVLPVNQLTQPGGRVKVNAGPVTWPDVEGVVDLTSVGSTPPAYLNVPDLPPTLRLLTEAGPAIGVLAWAIGMALVAMVVRDVSRGTPFGSRVATRVAALGLVIILGPFASTTLEWIAGEVVVDRADVDQLVSPYYVLPLGAVLAGALAFALAEAFRQGRRLTAEVEGLV